MNRRKAKQTAYEGLITYGELQGFIDKASRTGTSKLNKNIPREMALGIMEGAIKGKDPTHYPVTTTYNHRDKLTLTMQGINAMNILIECG